MDVGGRAKQEARAEDERSGLLLPAKPKYHHPPLRRTSLCRWHKGSAFALAMNGKERRSPSIANTCPYTPHQAPS